MPKRGKQERCRLGLRTHSTSFPLCITANAYLSQSANSAVPQLCSVSSWEQTCHVTSNWVLKASGIWWLEHMFSKNKTGIKLLFPLGMKCLSKLWCSYKESTTPLPTSPLPALWNPKTGLVTPTIWTTSLPKSHNIYSMTRTRNLLF